MADFLPAIDWVIDRHEGGFQKIASDPGNYYNGELIGTKWGVSAPVARDHGWTGRMEDMPRSWAIENVYRRSYWPGLDGITSQAVATKILDMRLSGVRRADRYVQQGLQSLGWQIAVDGVIGPQTTAALNKENESTILQMLVSQQTALYASSYKANPIGQSWFNVWMRRAQDIPDMVLVAGVSLVGLAVVLAVAYVAAQA